MVARGKKTKNQLISLEAYGSFAHVGGSKKKGAGPNLRVSTVSFEGKTNREHAFAKTNQKGERGKEV